MSTRIDRVDGLVVSVSDPEPHRRLFLEAIGMNLLSDERLGEREVEALWGIAGHAARVWTLGAVREIGVQLVAFDPPANDSIRGGAAGTDSDALKVCDFLVRDFAAARERMERFGFPLAADPATYEVPGEGRFTEGHIDGPDGIKIALLHAHDAEPGRFCREREALFSEVLGFSAPVSDADAVRAFYEALELRQVFRYEIESAGFEAMVGIESRTKAVGINYGLSEIEPMIGVIHYGLPAESYASLAARATFPNRGYVAVRLGTRSVEAVAERARQCGLEIVAGPTRLALAPWGEIRSILLRAPHGVLHHVIERSGVEGAARTGGKDG